jgi:hypothetical protein
VIARQVLTKGQRGPLSTPLIGLEETELAKLFISALDAEESEEKKGAEYVDIISFLLVYSLSHAIEDFEICI